MFLAERIISIVAPHACLVCRQEGWLLCPWCRDACRGLPDRCYRCRAVTRDSAVCKKCKRTSALSHVWVATEYEGVAKELIYTLKFGRASAAARDAAAVMIQALPYLDEATIVTHMPTATTRVRQRGYDHAKLLARAVAREVRLDTLPLLARLGQSRQVGARKAQRETQLMNAFRPLNSNRIRGKKILLIDDVVTTGASLEAAAKVLRRAGATSVDACVFAQK